MANYTLEQQAFLDQLATYGKRLQELAYSTTGKFVVAGYAGNSTETSKLYCFCGSDKGYKGAPISPAHAEAVLFASKAKAQAVASQLKYNNGRGERITLQVMQANEYFWLLFDETCRVMNEAETVINQKQ